MRAASEYLNDSSDSVTWRITTARRLRIHLSSSNRSLSATGRGTNPSRESITKRDAFQSLLQKLRAASNRSPTIGPGGSALSASVSAHWVLNSLPHFGQAIFGRIRFFFVCSMIAPHEGHSKSSPRRTSWLSVVRYAIANRSESAPNFSITKTGSIPFPFDFDMPSPYLSRIFG